MAGQEAHVYKYADRPELFYQCQMTISIKEPNSECIRPECAEPQGFGATKTGSGQRSQRKQRDISAWHDPTNTLDVRTELSTLEIMDGMDNDVLQNLKQNKNELMDISSVRLEFIPPDLCFSSGAFAVIIVMFGTLLCAIFIIVIFFCRPKKSKL
ncbi:unnamed protein product [Cercopithifilaria johnstoni]|uniref:Cuticlin C-terminal domain-containing protein n=1 Tax=Cercopithifilaria johnstoni TaxID=2874296 RepID=A0A8J2Q3F9_9BILA|nr:unnamed protein product [Cercopithifilaria johnstoni]